MKDLAKSLNRRRIIEESGVRKVWTPHQPVSSVDLFWGRLGEINSIVDAVETPGQHAILYGDRGVGKSSLANVATLLLKSLKGHDQYVCRCDSQSTFASITQGLLDHLGIQIDRPEIASTTATRATGNVGLPGLGAGAHAEHSRSERRGGRSAELTPAVLARALAATSILFVVDELDAVTSRGDRMMVAELMKQLSDAHIAVKLLVVGIATSTVDLLAGHPSVHRNLKEVHLGRMTNPEVRELVLGNAEKTRLNFAPPVVAEIVQLSDGFPYFAQLLGLKCAELAVVAKKRTVFPADLATALRVAVQDAEETLRSTYSDAVRSNETNMYAWIVQSAAAVDSLEITARELRAGVSALAGRTVFQQDINNAFNRLVRTDESAILKRESKGIYRFSDPRMKVYARLVGRVGAQT